MHAPLVASAFLQTDGIKAAQLVRKNGAATSRPPIACGFRSACWITPNDRGFANFVASPHAPLMDPPREECHHDAFPYPEAAT